MRYTNGMTVLTHTELQDFLNVSFPAAYPPQDWTEYQEPPPAPYEPTWDDIIEIRNAKLKDSDWTQLPDVVLTVEQKLAWSAYRQSLRDIPQNFLDPSYVTFPEVPNG